MEEIVKTVNPVKNWGAIEGFKEEEFLPPENPKKLNTKMNLDLIEKIVLIRKKAIEKYGFARIIINKNGGFSFNGHSKSSLHYRGRAIDFYIEVGLISHTQNGIGLKEYRRLSQVESAILCYENTDKNFGIGVYSWGIHLDYRKGVGDRTDAVWFRSSKDGQYHFHAYRHFEFMIADAITDLPEFLCKID